MRTTFYFVRHAESLSNVDPLFKGSDDVLSEAGLKQAQSLALRFKHIRVEKMYTSNIFRAQQTAAEIEKVIAIKPEVYEFLKERSGSFSAELHFTSNEAFEKLKKRLDETKHFLENLSHKHVVVVTHAIFQKSLAAYLMLGDSLTEELLHKIEDILVVENAGVSKLVFNKEKSKWRIMAWNDLADSRC